MQISWKWFMTEQRGRIWYDSFHCDSQDIDPDAILKGIKERNKEIFIDRVQCVGVESLADFGVVLRFIADVTEENIFKGKRLLNKEIKIAFDKANITIPYPQIDVHNK